VPTREAGFPMSQLALHGQLPDGMGRGRESVLVNSIESQYGRCPGAFLSPKYINTRPSFTPTVYGKLRDDTEPAPPNPGNILGFCKRYGRSTRRYLWGPKHPKKNTKQTNAPKHPVKKQQAKFLKSNKLFEPMRNRARPERPRNEHTRYGVCLGIIVLHPNQPKGATLTRSEKELLAK